MSQKTSPSEALPMPVVYLHAKGRSPVSAEDVAALTQSGCEVCCRQGAEGAASTEHGLDEPGELLVELGRRFPGRSVVFLRSGLAPTKDQLYALAEIAGAGEEPSALTLLSNAWSELNPFAGVEWSSGTDLEDPSSLVALLAPGYLHEIVHWPGHFALIPAGTVKRMAELPAGSLMQRLSATGGRLLVADHLFLHDPDTRIDAAPRLEPWESSCPPPFGELTARLQCWISAGKVQARLRIEDDRPATLHVTHSWGGGIAHWIETFIENDEGRAHYQLRAEGPRSDLGCGQRLSLYAANELELPIASWWLQPPIRSVEDRVPEYAALLGAICRRYRIGRVVVSSLVGHSLDALRTGLPTLQVLHDHFPLWPLLSAHPGPWLQENADVDIGPALESRVRQEFTDKTAGEWTNIRDYYLAALNDHEVSIAAPGPSVIDLQKRLAPAFPADRAVLIPHGTKWHAGLEAVEPRPREDGRLRMVVLGRIQDGKGRELLKKAVGALTERVHVYLVGSGKSGEAFFGVSGVDVIPEYDPESLPGLMRDIGPDFAALLSIVPETFSFTLSELQLMRVPVIATRVGSFPSRIAHGKTGWLIEPDPSDLVGRVRELCDDPGQIASVRAALADIHVQTPGEMVASYRRAFTWDYDPGILHPVPPKSDAIQAAAADHELSRVRTTLSGVETERDELRDELELRTERLSREIENRTKWAQATQQKLEREHDTRRRVEQHLSETRGDLERLRRRHEHLEARHQRVLSSISWRLTRPLRAARRVLDGIRNEGAWNPAAWPALARGEPVHSEMETSPVEIERSGPPEALPMVERPVASIVVPVYNNWGLTAACLKSLADTASEQYPFEVIVVDDCSADETPDRLAEIKNLTVLRNEQNLGFVGSCNRGAAAARGRFMAFLNNDTRVTDGWLDTLIDTLENEPGAGLVGARLVYPSGRLQESGGIIYSDGSGWNYGRDEPAGNPAYGFMRETDYCSGAAIVMRRELFERLGGFDERYAPAYYEDTDLAFRIREAGLRVLVQPAATVIHHEGATSGNDISSGMKRYQAVNQSKFVERWADALASQPDPVRDRHDHKALREATEARQRGRVLFLAPDDDTAQVRVKNLLLGCRRSGFGATLADPGGTVPAEEVLQLARTGVELLQPPWMRGLKVLLKERGARFDVIVLPGRISGAKYLASIRRACPGARVVFDMGVRAGDALTDLERHAERTLVKLTDATLRAPDDETACEELVAILRPDD